MSEWLHFSVLTPEKKLLDVANVRKVSLKLADHGWLSIYPRHAPLLAETLAGPVKYTTAAGTETISLAESILQVADNLVILFTVGELTAPEAGIPDVADNEDDEEAEHFDRLARALLVSLGASFDGETDV
ncbi:MAG TPA: hypothetical protein PLJ78_08900 [Anaerolineae bacterium]|nr:hypothetical protein [Anaerolineae bacterium]HQK14043.1 hypothetical protein [Anaerolineae bacterium]